MTATSYSFNEARAALKTVLDSTERGGLSTIHRRNHPTAAVVSGDLLRRYLARTTPSNAQVNHDDEAWAVFVPGQSFAGEGDTLDEAVADFIEGLREYAEDWEEHFSQASNHRDNWPLVQLVTLSTDEQLASWVTGGGR